MCTVPASTTMPACVQSQELQSIQALLAQQRCQLAAPHAQPAAGTAPGTHFQGFQHPSDCLPSAPGAAHSSGTAYSAAPPAHKSAHPDLSAPLSNSAACNGTPSVAGTASQSSERPHQGGVAAQQAEEHVHPAHSATYTVEEPDSPQHQGPPHVAHQHAIQSPPEQLSGVAAAAGHAAQAAVVALPDEHPGHEEHVIHRVERRQRAGSRMHVQELCHAVAPDGTLHMRCTSKCATVAT